MAPVLDSIVLKKPVWHSRSHAMDDNPIVVKRRRQIKCSICGCLGHTTRSKLHHNAGGPLGQDISLSMAIYPSSQ